MPIPISKKQVNPKKDKEKSTWKHIPAKPMIKNRLSMQPERKGLASLKRNNN